MAKDPAFLFYYQDFLVGTDEMTNEETGAYIKCLCHQAHKGHITKQHMINICKTDYILNIVMKKFDTDGNGNFYNTRLNEEKIKREKHCDNQRQRALDGWAKRKSGIESGNAAALPLEDEDENEDKDKTETKNKRAIEIKFIIGHLNKLTGQSYKPTTRKTVDCINARYNEGFNSHDFIKVLNIKVREWIGDPKNCKWLRPETLFGPKFEGYLQQITREEKSMYELAGGGRK